MTIYDRNVQMYVEFIDRVLAMDGNPFDRLATPLIDHAGSPAGRILDVGCGEGYLSRRLGERAHEAVGIDISTELIDVARSRTDATNVRFEVGDAQSLSGFDDASFDGAVSQMAIMDIPDHRAVFAAVRRVLKDEAPFAFSLLHPCFEGPYGEGEERYVQDDDGVWTANIVRSYAREGHWRPAGDGVRGAVGSHHRMLSTYVNDLVAAGFRLERMEEPVGGPGVLGWVPRVMAILARAS